MNPRQLERWVYQLLPAWQSEQPTLSAWQYLEGGFSNDNFAFQAGKQRFVLRVPKHPRDATSEQAWYQSLPSDIGVKPLVIDANSGAMISPWVEGELLVNHWRRPGIANLTKAEIEGVLVGYLHQLHSQLPNTDRHYQLPAVASHILERTELQTCHNDLNPWNIIVTPEGKWITLDWEWVGLNDPLFDLVALHQGLDLSGGLFDLAASYLGESAAHCEQRTRVMLRQFWQRELTWAQTQIDKGNRREEILTQARNAHSKLTHLDDIR